MSQVFHAARYEAAKERRIKNNRRISGQRKWFAAHADAQRLSDWLNNSREFRPRCCCGNDHGYDAYSDPTFNEETCRMLWHPARPTGAFLDKMRDALDQWGGLSDNQTKAVREALEKSLKRADERDAKIAAQREADLKGGYIGTIGKRSEITATVSFVTDYETQYGVTYIYGLRDADGNVIIAKGQRLSAGEAGGWKAIERGDKLRLTAYVKDHGVRDEVKQTIINRVKIIERVGA
jgi:hypothetical protein